MFLVATALVPNRLKAKGATFLECDVLRSVLPSHQDCVPSTSGKLSSTRSHPCDMAVESPWQYPNPTAGPVLVTAFQAATRLD